MCHLFGGSGYNGSETRLGLLARFLDAELCDVECPKAPADQGAYSEIELVDQGLLRVDVNPR